MFNERFQNDRHFIWYFYLKDKARTPFNLEGKDLALDVKVGMSVFHITEYTVTGNSIDFYFRGRTQTRPGLIELILFIDKGKNGQQTFDAIAGGMVPHSDMAGPCGPSGARADTAGITSFVGEWIDDRLIPASIARADDMNDFKTQVSAMFDRLQEAAHWSDGFVWKDSLIWRE